ncbi:MAG: DUF1573 domain-containing protein [Muribaculaceae bacterium]|nr:DUF1573 domain-containing protein [Muribaculaceae bacterium]MBQ3605419.1 DUF1573 domain-containing protein [Muribaculaceae bacterium]MBQ7854860.1 DUF1573 domain-containing protein [Muribaculaceae bacterium]MBR3830952.1 DUF1573 domain-containing protein [Muribaculaceae bacterium]
MKRIISIFTLILMSAVAFNIMAAGKGAEMTFNEKTHDFGTIKEANGPVTHTFEFTNTGGEPLVIINVNASCGCTRPEYPKEPIMPGKKGKVKVTFNPAGRPGEFSKEVKIRTNGDKRPILRITGTVIPK